MYASNARIRTETMAIQPHGFMEAFLRGFGSEGFFTAADAGLCPVAVPGKEHMVPVSEIPMDPAHAGFAFFANTSSLVSNLVASSAATASGPCTTASVASTGISGFMSAKGGGGGGGGGTATVAGSLMSAIVCPRGGTITPCPIMAFRLISSSDKGAGAPQLGQYSQPWGSTEPHL